MIAALSALELIADTFLSVNTPVQVAAPDLFRRAAAIRQAIHQRVARNLAAARDVVRDRIQSCEVLRTEGGWSAVVRVPATRSEEALALDLLQHEHVLVHPGFFFDFPHEAFVVVSLLPPEDVFADAFGRCSGTRAHDESPSPIAARGATRPAVLDSVLAQLGHRRDRRSRARVPPGSSAPDSACCSCCRSTRCRCSESSPYSALSAMAIDPQFITLDDVEDFAAIGGEGALEPEWRARLDAVRAAPAIDYAVGAGAQVDGAAARRSRIFSETEWKRELASRGAVPRLRRRAGVVAG